MAAATWGTAAIGEWSAAEVRPGMDRCIEETPVALVYNGTSHAAMLASPADLEDFALGFSLTARIVETAADVHDIEMVAPPRSPQPPVAGGPASSAVVAHGAPRSAKRHAACRQVVGTGRNMPRHCPAKTSRRLSPRSDPP